MRHIMKKFVACFTLLSPLLILPVAADIIKLREELEHLNSLKTLHQSALEKGLDREVVIKLKEGRIETSVVDHNVIYQSLKNRTKKLSLKIQKEEERALESTQIVSPNSLKQNSDSSSTDVPFVQTPDIATTLTAVAAESPSVEQKEIGQDTEISTNSLVFSQAEAERTKVKIRYLYHSEEDPVWTTLFKTRHEKTQDECESSTSVAECKRVKKEVISFATHNPLPIPTEEIDKELGPDHLYNVELSKKLISALKEDYKAADLIDAHSLRDNTLLKPVFFVVLSELFLREKSYDYAMHALGEALKSKLTAHQATRIKIYTDMISSVIPSELSSFTQIKDILDM